MLNHFLLRVTAHFVEIMSEVKANVRDFQRYIQIPQQALDRAALWLTQQRGARDSIATEFGNINNKWLEVRDDCFRLWKSR